jgi:hypothetical protein
MRTSRACHLATIWPESAHTTTTDTTGRLMRESLDRVVR